MVGTSTQLSNSTPLLDVSGAAIQGDSEETNPSILLPNQSDDLSHIALDIGGSLIKLVYFLRHEDSLVNDNRNKSTETTYGVTNDQRRSVPVLGGRLHFVNFETCKIDECLEFIHSKQLHQGDEDYAVIKVTGGGAYKFEDLFKERLGVSIENEDELDCVVAGANFLLKVIRHEAFTHKEGCKEFVQIDDSEIYPYLLVNIGSGVGMMKVDGEGKFELVGGTYVGGGTYWGLGKLLTKCKSYDELLELSQKGNYGAVDMLVGDVYGGLDYSKFQISATTIAASFGKGYSENKQIEDYRPEDISLCLLNMISYNMGQLSCLTALQHGIKRIIFGGSFIRGNGYTMDTISSAIRSWSKGGAEAIFLRHEGFLGAVGAFMSNVKHGSMD